MHIDNADEGKFFLIRDENVDQPIEAGGVMIVGKVAVNARISARLITLAADSDVLIGKDGSLNCQTLHSEGNCSINGDSSLINANDCFIKIGFNYVPVKKSCFFQRG